MRNETVDLPQFKRQTHDITLRRTTSLIHPAHGVSGHFNVPAILGVSGRFNVPSISEPTSARPNADGALQPLPTYVSSRPPSSHASALHFPPLVKQVRAKDHGPCAFPCPVLLHLLSLARSRAPSLSHAHDSRSWRNFTQHTRLKTLAKLARHQSGNCVVYACLHAFARCAQARSCVVEHV